MPKTLANALSLYRRRWQLRRRGVVIHNNTVWVAVEFRGEALIEPYCRLNGAPRIVLGHNFFMNAFGFMKGDITIGDDVQIGPGAVLWGMDHGMEPGRPIRTQPLYHEPIVVGDDVWIAAHAVVLKGVTIGSGAVVGAGSVVTRDVPEGAIVVGNPARVLRYRGEGGAASSEAPPGAAQGRR